MINAHSYHAQRSDCTCGRNPASVASTCHPYSLLHPPAMAGASSVRHVGPSGSGRSEKLIAQMMGVAGDGAPRCWLLRKEK